MGIWCEIPCGMGLKCTCGTPCMCCGYYDKDPKTSTFNSFIVFTVRTIKDATSYKASFDAFAKKAQSGSNGVRACFSFIDKDTATKAVQFAWYDTPEDFKSVLEQAKVLAGEYTGASDDWATVWGRKDAAVEAAANASGVVHQFEAAPKGFSLANGPGFSYKGPPMIWVSKRKVKPGTAPDYLRMWQKAADMQAMVAPGLIASSEKNHPDADHIMSLRVFTDFAKGFQAHAVSGFPCILYALGSIPGAFKMPCCYPAGAPLMQLDGPFPIGVAFCSKTDLQKAIALNPGNKSYKAYEWTDGLIGPMPDFAKGKGGGASSMEMER
jgi:hypothetical protein